MHLRANLLASLALTTGTLLGCAGSPSDGSHGPGGKADEGGSQTSFVQAAEAAISAAFHGNGPDQVDPATAPAGAQSLFERYSSDVTQLYRLDVRECADCDATRPVFVVGADEDSSISVFDATGDEIAAGKIDASGTTIEWIDPLVDAAKVAVATVYGTDGPDLLTAIDPATAPAHVQALFDSYSLDVTGIYQYDVMGQIVYIVSSDADSSITVFDATGAQIATGKLADDAVTVTW